jgi:uncharacterized protein (TIGR04168 family)
MKTITIAIVGDVHGCWHTPAEELALHQLGVDLVLFVGDFGNEDVALVQAVADLNLPKAIILGNHDAWFTATERGRAKCPYDRQTEDRVQIQLDLLGKLHVGYSYLDFPELGLSVVGARPFSWGGNSWQSTQFYQTYFGIADFASSVQRINQALQNSAFSTVIMLGHNGPAGLGEEVFAPCGRDWDARGGDHGDPDFAEALLSAYAMGKQVPLVAFGHMHNRLAGGTAQRQMVATNERGTVFVNGAIVPRLVPVDSAVPSAGYCRCFTLVTLCAYSVKTVQLVWFDPQYQIMSAKVWL